MIVIPQRLSWFRLLLRMRGTVNLRIWPRVVFFLVLSGVITWLHDAHGWFEQSLTTIPFTFVGLALSIFLGFRNSTSYERFWEGRRLWGQLINSSRNLARQSLTLIHSDDSSEQGEVTALQQQLVHGTIAYAHSLRSLLRGDDIADACRWLPPAQAQDLTRWQSPPLWIAQHLGDQIQKAYRRGWLHAQQRNLIEEQLSHLIDIQGGCERIRSTPIPFAYIVFLHQIVAIYCFALPFGVIDSLGTYTPFVVAIVASAFLGLDAIGDSIENPFEMDNHDLPLSGMCRTIEINLRQMLNDTDTPPPLQPDEDWVLL